MHDDVILTMDVRHNIVVVDRFILRCLNSSSEKVIWRRRPVLSDQPDLQDCVKRWVFRWGPKKSHTHTYTQGCHKPGKPGIHSDFSEHGKLREFRATSRKNCNKTKYFSSSFKYLVRVRWWPVVLLELTMVIITFTFCCDNLWKSKFIALEKPGKLKWIFSPT